MENQFGNNSSIPDSDFWIQFKKFNQTTEVTQMSIPSANVHNQFFNDQTLKNNHSKKEDLFGSCDISAIQKVSSST